MLCANEENRAKLAKICCFRVEKVQNMTNLVNKDTYGHKNTKVWKIWEGGGKTISWGNGPPVVPPLMMRWGGEGGQSFSIMSLTIIC